MGLFDKNNSKNDYEFDEFLIEFDAGGNVTNNDQEEELETIDDEDTGDQAEMQNDNPNGEQEDPELETMDDEGETEDNQEQEDMQNGEENTETDTEGDTGEDTGDENPDEEDEELETMDDEDGGLEGDTGEENTDGNMDTETPENDPHQKLKELEADIFDQLSDSEKEIKKNELKKLFINLIEKSDNIIDLLQEIPKTDETIRVLDYVNNTLSDLKTYLNDYVANMYDNRTYIQNTVNFQKYLAIFDSVKAILEEVKRIS